MHCMGLYLKKEKSTNLDILQTLFVFSFIHCLCCTLINSFLHFPNRSGLHVVRPNPSVIGREGGSVNFSIFHCKNRRLDVVDVFIFIYN